MYSPAVWLANVCRAKVIAGLLSLVCETGLKNSECYK